MADATITLRLIGRGPGTVEAFRQQLGRPEKLLKLFGYAAASEAQKSFDRQGLNHANEWPERYPGMDEPIVNIAGALMDLAKGPRIKPHRFENRPAVIDTGLLRRSLSPGGAVKITGTFSVEVGTTVPYGSAQQFGAEFDIPVTDAQKDNLREWYRREKGAAKRLDNQPLSAGLSAMRSEWLRGVMKKLGPLLNVDSIHQTVLARPFVGLNADLGTSMRRIAIDFYAGKGVA